MELPKAGEVKRIWQGFGRDIFTQRFSFPNGKEDDFFVFDTMKKSLPVIVFPFTKDREVVAIRQFRTGANAVVVEIPGGVPKPSHKTPEDTLRAELVEETGYRPGNVVSFAADWLWFEPASLRVRYVPFLALDCVYEKEPKLDEFEVMEVMKVPLGRWIEMIRNGDVRDDKSIALTLLALPYLGFELRAPDGQRVW